MYQEIYKKFDDKAYVNEEKDRVIDGTACPGKGKKNENKVGGMILAGGKNSRMRGQKKAFLSYQGRSFLSILIERLGKLEPLYLSVESEAFYQHFDRELAGLKLVEDQYPEVGPMGGIASVLSVCREDALFVAACDMPFLKQETVQTLLDAYDRQPDKVTIAQSGDRLHPLCGIYPVSSLPAIQELIQKENYRMKKLMEYVPVQIVPFPEGDPSFQNVNTVSEYEKLQDCIL